MRESTVMTHSDPEALWGALAIAMAAGFMASGNPSPSPIAYLEALRGLLAEADAATRLTSTVALACESVARGESTQRFASTTCRRPGVSGYVGETVPVCLHACFSYPDDFEGAVSAVIRCGGDADTTAAIVGGIVGSRVGVEGIPERYRAGIWDWPWNPRRLEQLAASFTNVAETSGYSPYGWLARLPRNGLFVLVVLVHGLRRMLPPY